MSHSWLHRCVVRAYAHMRPYRIRKSYILTLANFKSKSRPTKHGFNNSSTDEHIVTTFYLNPLPCFNFDMKLQALNRRVTVDTVHLCFFFPPKVVLFPDSTSLRCGIEIRHLSSITVFRPLLRLPVYNIH